MNNQWSENLRKRMEMHEEPSPEGLWEDLEQIIQKEDFAKPLSKSKKILLWSKCIAAVAAVAIIALVIGYNISNQEPEEIQLAIETPSQQDTPEAIISVSDEGDNSMVKTGSQLFIQKTNTKRSISAIATQTETFPSIDTVNLTIKEEAKIAQEILKEETLESKPKSDKTKNKRLYSSDSKSLDLASEFDFYENRQRNTPARWGANLYASNLSASTTNNYNGYGTLAPCSPPIDNSEADPDANEDPYGDILVQNKHKSVYTDVKHRQPVTVGVSVNYNLDENWSFTTGLTYTLLSSQLRSGSDRYYYNSEQSLHYIGIPLKINYNIWRNRKLSIYLSAGGQVEKNVSGKLTTDYIVDNKLESTKKDNISVDQLQLSLNTAIGIQYNLSKKIGLYAEPGVSYYFKNKSEIETIYKEKPLNIGLHFGLSLSLGGG